MSVLHHPRRPRGSQSGREKRRNESFQVLAKEPLGTDSHRAMSKTSSGCRILIGHKNCFVLLCPIGEQFLLSSFREFVHDGYFFDHGLSGSCTKEMHAVRKLSVWYKIPIWFQNTVCPKTKDAFPKIQAWAYNRYSRLHRSRLAQILGNFKKIPRRLTTTKSSHGKRNSLFFSFYATRLLCQMQSCKRTLLELNFYQPYPSTWKEWILSLLVYILHKTWN